MTQKADKAIEAVMAGEEASDVVDALGEGAFSAAMPLERRSTFARSGKAAGTRYKSAKRLAPVPVKPPS